jgi:hypothetical protein
LPGFASGFTAASFLHEPGRRAWALVTNIFLTAHQCMPSSTRLPKLDVAGSILPPALMVHRSVAQRPTKVQPFPRSLAGLPVVGKKRGLPRGNGPLGQDTVRIEVPVAGEGARRLDETRG